MVKLCLHIINNVLVLFYFKDMYLIMDFIPNHTSDKHEWFIKSCESDSSTNEYRDYYIWYPSSDKKNPPNNWVIMLKMLKS